MREFLVGYDGSETSKLALCEAVAVAQDADRLVVLNAFYVPAPLYTAALDEEVGQEVEADSKRLLDDVADDADLSGREVEFVSRRGLPAETIAQAADERNSDAIVVGSRGLSPIRAALGSETIRLLSRTTRPVLVVPDHDPVVGRSNDILVAYDDSPEARRALHAATEMASATGGKILLANAYSVPATAVAAAYVGEMSQLLEEASEEILRAGADIANEAGVAVERHAAAGSPAEVMVELSRKLSPRMIAMGSRGHGAVRAALGSQALRLLHVADRPVLITPRRAEAGRDRP